MCKPRLHSFLTLTLEMSGQLHALATLPLGSNPDTHCRGCVGPKAELDILEKRKISCPCHGLNHGSSST